MKFFIGVIPACILFTLTLSQNLPEHSHHDKNHPGNLNCLDILSRLHDDAVNRDVIISSFGLNLNENDDNDHFANRIFNKEGQIDHRTNLDQLNRIRRATPFNNPPTAAQEEVRLKPGQKYISLKNSRITKASDNANRKTVPAKSRNIRSILLGKEKLLLDDAAIASGSNIAIKDGATNKVPLIVNYSFDSNEESKNTNVNDVERVFREKRSKVRRQTTPFNPNEPGDPEPLVDPDQGYQSIRVGRPRDPRPCENCGAIHTH